jgi:putative DNA primase/helicase
MLKSGPDLEVIRRLFRDYLNQPRWLEWREQGDDKAPYIAGTKRRASHSDPQHWRTFEQCRGDRRGLVFNGDGLGGIDLDGCRNPETRELTAWAQEAVAEFGSYAEVSPSGTGVKIFALGAPTELLTHVLPMSGEPINSKRPQVEAYVTKRYFTVTGDKLPDAPDEVRAAPEAWARLVERLREQRERDGRQPAGRNAALIQLGGRLRRAGADADKVRAELTAANNRDSGLHPSFATEGPLDDNELERCIRSVLKFTPGDQRAVIELYADRLHAAAEAAEEVLAATTRVYRQDTALVRFVFERADTSKGRPTAVARIRPYGLALLQRELSQHLRCVKFNKDGTPMPAGPPDRLMEMVLAEASPKFAELAGIIEAPTLRPDGSLLIQEGYDAVTGLMLVNPPPMPASAEHPTRADAEAALLVLGGLLAEYPFVDDAARSVALSALITPVVRGALRHVPAHAVSAPEGGTGKGHLLENAAYIANGRALASTGVSKLGRGSYIDGVELDKRLTGAVLAGQTFIYLDNISAPLDSDFLCQIITQPLLEVRRLGSTGQIRVRPVATVFITGNNLEIANDLIRRTIQCRLDSGLEDPTVREFRQQPHELVLADRGRYIAAALTLVRAHLAAGAPGVALVPPLAGFEDWSRLVRGALVWLGRADPVATQEGLRVANPAAAGLDAVMEVWAEGLAQTSGPHKMVDRWLTARELVENFYPPFAEALREVTHARDLELVSAVKLGMFLKKNTDRVRNGMKIISDYDSHSRVTRWRLVGWREFVAARDAVRAEAATEAAATVVPLPTGTARPTGRKATRKQPEE